jgi:hypothetical protein
VTFEDRPSVAPTLAALLNRAPETEGARTRALERRDGDLGVHLPSWRLMPAWSNYVTVLPCPAASES